LLRGDCGHALSLFAILNAEHEDCMAGLHLSREGSKITSHLKGEKVEGRPRPKSGRRVSHVTRRRRARQEPEQPGQTKNTRLQLWPHDLGEGQ